MIVVAGHATLVNGKLYESPNNTIVETLKKMEQDFVYIRHSIDGSLPSTAYWHKRGNLVRESKLWVARKPSILRYTNEIITTVFYILLHPALWGANYIGIDPLNSFSGIILRSVAVFKKSIFFTADYSTTRFKGVMNSFYHSLDRFSVKRANQTWNVSSRIKMVREKMGLTPEKNIFVPNVPSSDYKKFLDNKKDKYALVTLGIISEQLDFVNVFTALANLAKKYPKISFKIIGNGPKEDEYKEMVKKMGVAERVHFLGFMSHDDALDTISKSGIGLALYNGNWSFNYYGDSMKIREFFCFGLPVLTTDTHSTVDDVQSEKAGLVTPMSADEYQAAIEEMLSNYESYSAGSRRIAEKYDGIHERLLAQFV